MSDAERVAEAIIEGLRLLEQGSVESGDSLEADARRVLRAALGEVGVHDKGGGHFTNPDGGYGASVSRSLPRGPAMSTDQTEGRVEEIRDMAQEIIDADYCHVGRWGDDDVLDYGGIGYAVLDLLEAIDRLRAERDELREALEKIVFSERHPADVLTARRALHTKGDGDE